MVEKFFNSMDVEVYRSFLYALYSDNKNDLSDNDIAILIKNTREFIIGADTTGSADPKFANLVIAVELLVNRPDIQGIQRFQSLEMSENDIAAIKFAADIRKSFPVESSLSTTPIGRNKFIMQRVGIEEYDSDADMAAAIEDNIGRCASEFIELTDTLDIVKLMVARSALNHLTTSSSFTILTQYISTMSDFILSKSSIDTSNVGDLLNEVALKWK